MPLVDKAKGEKQNFSLHVPLFLQFHQDWLFSVRQKHNHGKQVGLGWLKKGSSHWKDCYFMMSTSLGMIILWSDSLWHCPKVRAWGGTKVQVVSEVKSRIKHQTSGYCWALTNALLDHRRAPWKVGNGKDLSKEIILRWIWWQHKTERAKAWMVYDILQNPEVKINPCISP